jgi:hypothetical protein
VKRSSAEKDLRKKRGVRRAGPRSDALHPV